jgi:23S rRNA U2552 (ribose-2'-O)-methylase RlmE/FtsJ
MENVYTRVEFPCTINVPPNMLHKGLYDELEKKVKKRFEGTCVPKIGYIKKGSVQIIKKQNGRSEGAHFTGNVTFKLQVRCSAAHPVVGQIIPCMVTGKNEIGILTTNYQLPAYTMLIVRMPNDTSDALDRVQKGSYIEVKILDFQLKAANDAERTKPEYWIICSLTNTKTEESRYQILPPVADKPTPMLNIHGLGKINDIRDDLSNGAYGALEESKKTIQTIRTKYLEMITADKGKLVNEDIFLRASRNHGDFILGTVEKVELRSKGTYLHHVTVIRSNLNTLPYGSTIKVQVYEHGPSSEGTTILYQGYAGGKASSHTPLDIWGRHIKYVINETEMVHAQGKYLAQVTAMIKGSMTEKVQTKKEGRKVLFSTMSNRPVASIVCKDRNVISRAYYKMIEMIHFFGEDIFLDKSMKVACIADSPGGFIQALLDQRVYSPYGESKIETAIKDDITAVSIGIDCGAWESLSKKVREDYHEFVNLRLGDDTAKDAEKTNLLLIGGTTERDDQSGNILNPDIRARYYKEFAEDKADLITGDAGVEHDKTTTTEEMDTHKLLLAEIVMALNCQKTGGSFILKIYDMGTEFTMNLLELLSYCYEEIGLFKPGTSRAASSEKYLVCKHLQVKDIDREDLLVSLEIILKTDTGVDSEGQSRYFGNMIGVANAKLKEAVISYNSFYMKKQIGFIETGRNYAVTYNNAISTGNADKMYYNILAKVGSQVSTADDFQHMMDK